MAYIEQDDPKLIVDLLSRKEFNYLRRWHDKKDKPPGFLSDIIPRFLLEDAISRSGNLKLSSYQMFVENFMNPNTPYKRLLLKWGTGLGKTIGALSIAMTFINHYRLEKEIGNVEIGSVFVIGFSEQVFKNDLLRFPEFGFLTKAERYKLDKLRRLAAVGSKVDVDRYTDMVTKIRKRLSNRKGNGFFRFYGYKAFVNRIFKAGPGVNLNEMTEEQIRTALSQGKLTYDEELLSQFKNSLIICDEIHNVYNSLEKNNWGIAVQAVLDHEPTCRALFASATPLNNSPTEIIDLANLLLPSDKRLNKDDFFDRERDLKPGALDTLGKLLRGKISFIIDVNPKYYPEVFMEGESLNEIPYLKFIRCPMSSFQYHTYKKVYTGTLSQDSQYLVDFVLENPSPKNENPDDLGIYQTNQIKSLLTHASQKWKDKYGLDFIDGKITGNALRRDKLERYSSKYVRMLDELMSDIRNKKGKVMIYHNIVHMSGVLFIEQVLLRNGFIDEFGGSTDNTICMRCGRTKKEHSREEILGGRESDTTDKSSSLSSNDLDMDEIEQADIKLIKKGKKLHWIRNGKYILTLERVANPDKKSSHKYAYYIKAASMDNRLLNATTYLIKEFTYILTCINIPIIIQVPIYAPRLGEWLLHVYFKIQSHNNKYVILVWKPSYITNQVVGDKALQSVFTNALGSYGGTTEMAEINNLDLSNNQSNKDDHLSNNQFDKSEYKLYSNNQSECKSDNNLQPNKSEDNLQSSTDASTATSIATSAATSVLDNPQNEVLLNSIVGLDPSKTGGKKKVTIRKRTKLKDGKHKFIPARFIMAHSEIEKSTMSHSIEKFNNSDNADGSRFLILVGSKIIKESYNFKAIRNEYMMGRTDNIPMFIQVRGRAIRKDSHKDLPLEQRNVNIKIFTTCLPEKQKIGVDKGKYRLSYEEEKYKEKIMDFQVMQKIEKMMHENAIDAYVNFDAINRYISDNKDPLSALPFTPNIDKKFNREMHLSELNLSTFNIYHQDKEVELCKSIIKRLFIEISGVWEYTDLLKAVRDPLDYELDINTHLISEESYLIALDQLCWNNDERWTEPFMAHSAQEESIEDGSSHHYIAPHLQHSGHPSYIVDRLYDTNDKIITLPGGQDSIIVPILDNHHQFYILFPVNFNNNEPDIDIELPYRVNKQEIRKSINMNSFVQTKRIDFDYDDKKKIFYRKYVDISIDNMEATVCEYGTTFHIKFLEEIIEYCFRAWTDPKLEKSEMHEFYFKMLYYYDLLSLVMWAYTTKPRIFKDYTAYAIPVKAKDIKLKALSKYEKRKEELEDISPDDNSDLATSGIINMLKSSINRTSNVWIPREFREQYDKTIQQSLDLFVGKRKKNKNINKVSADLLPIGHFISKFPRIFHPQRGWSEDPLYTQSEQSFIENNLIVGYNERSKTGVHIRFKLRNPIHNIKKFKDSRLVERGSVCRSKSKSYLKNIAQKLDITIPTKTNVEELCVLIRSKLIRLELKERIKKSKIKYFYFHYENNLSEA